MNNFKKIVLPFSLLLCLIIIDDTDSVISSINVRNCPDSIKSCELFSDNLNGRTCYLWVWYWYSNTNNNPKAIIKINNGNCAARRYIAYLRTYKESYCYILNWYDWCKEAEKRCLEPLRMLEFESEVYPSLEIRQRSHKGYEEYKEKNKNNDDEIVTEETFLKTTIIEENMTVAKSINVNEIDAEVRENIRDYITYVKNITTMDVNNFQDIDTFCIKKCIEQLNAVGYTDISLTDGRNNKIKDTKTFTGCAMIFAIAKKKKGCMYFQE